MTDPATADTPLAIDRVDSARAEGDSVRLRLSGRWLGTGHPGEHDALLVVQLQGRRHRFPAISEGGDTPLPPGAWVASFTLPAWAEPRQPGQAALWVGNAVIPVPPPGTRPAAAPSQSPSPSASAAPTPAAAPAVDPAPARVAPAEPRADPAIESGRPGPLADLLFKETVSALHNELEQRSAEAARLRGALADAQSELEARAATQAGLEATHGELRGELQQLIAAVARQRAEFEQWRSDAEAQQGQLRRQLSEATATRDEAVALRERLAAASVSRDAAISEVAGLRAELERLGTELAVTREQLGAQGGDLGEAQRLLADARALTEQLGGPPS
jgi:predicted  nucleic acid-binding Zn-ribbon protein